MYAAWLSRFSPYSLRKSSVSYHLRIDWHVISYHVECAQAYRIRVCVCCSIEGVAPIVNDFGIASLARLLLPLGNQ